MLRRLLVELGAREKRRVQRVEDAAPSPGRAASSCRPARSPRSVAASSASRPRAASPHAGAPAGCGVRRTARPRAAPPRTPARPRTDRRRRSRARGASGSRSGGTSRAAVTVASAQSGRWPSRKMLASSRLASTASGRPISIDCSSATRARRSRIHVSAGFTDASGRGIRSTVASRMMTIRSRMRVTPMRWCRIISARRADGYRAPARRREFRTSDKRGSNPTIGAKRYGRQNGNSRETPAKRMAPQVLLCSPTFQGRGGLRQRKMTLHHERARRFG